MKHTCHIWLMNGEDLLRYDWATPSFYAGISPEPEEYCKRQGYIYIGAQEFDLPSLDPESIWAKTIEGLREQIKTVRAEAETAAIKIEKRIGDLLLLGYCPEKDSPETSNF